MGEDAARLKLYEAIIRRHASLISEKENISISELRSRISPYNEFVRKIRVRLIADMQPYDHPTHFFDAVQRAIAYIQSIDNIELPVIFHSTFEEIDALKAASLLDQALLLAALLRSLESKEVKVILTKNSKYYVTFEWETQMHLINPASGSLLSGGDTQRLLEQDPPTYAFSDLFFESYEE